MTYRYQDDGSGGDKLGNEVTVDGSNGVQTKEQAEENPNTAGAQINAAQKYDGRIQAGGEAAQQANAEEAFEGHLDRLVELTQIVTRMDAADKKVPSHIREEMVLLNDQTQISGAFLTEEVLDKITKRINLRRS